MMPAFKNNRIKENLRNYEPFLTRFELRLKRRSLVLSSLENVLTARIILDGPFGLVSSQQFCFLFSLSLYPVLLVVSICAHSLSASVLLPTEFYFDRYVAV